jgi:hypothetical protein
MIDAEIAPPENALDFSNLQDVRPDASGKSTGGVHANDGGQSALLYGPHEEVHLESVQIQPSMSISS